MRTTAIIVGIGRAETSLVAGALRELGIPIRDAVDSAKMASLIEDGGRTEQLRTMIERNNALHDAWGLELQESFRSLPGVLHLFHNPRVIVAFRDSATSAAAIKGKVSERLDLGALLTRAAVENLALAELVRATRDASLAVGYEQIVASPGKFVLALAGHCGIQPREGQQVRAVRSIKSSGGSRAEAPDFWYEGQLTSVDSNAARGWARRMPANEPCMVEVVSDGAVIGRAVSNRPFKSDDRAISDRGFSVELTAPPGKAFGVRIAGTSTTLAVAPTGRGANRPPNAT